MSLPEAGQSASLYTILSGNLLPSIYRLNRVIVSHKECYRNKKNREESREIEGKQEKDSESSGMFL